METFEIVKVALEELEHSSFAHLNENFVASDEIGECISGATQFFVLDRGEQLIKSAFTR